VASFDILSVPSFSLYWVRGIPAFISDLASVGPVSS
jgi:hypothetical protein